MNIQHFMNIQQWLSCILSVTNVFNFHITFLEGVVFTPLNVKQVISVDNDNCSRHNTDSVESRFC